MKNNPEIIVPDGLNAAPEEREFGAALILAHYFRTDVEFLRPVDDYKRKTPDVKIGGKLWEIKTLEGHSRTTVGNQIQRASKQSKYIVIDSRFTKLLDSVVIINIRRELKARPSIKEVLLINKLGKVVEVTSSK
jgi:hypothetical protein